MKFLSLVLIAAVGSGDLIGAPVWAYRTTWAAETAAV